MGRILSHIDCLLRRVNRNWDALAYRRVTRRIGRAPLKKKPSAEVARWELDALGRVLGEHDLAHRVQHGAGERSYLFGYPLVESAGRFYVQIEERVRGYRD